MPLLDAPPAVSLAAVTAMAATALAMVLTPGPNMMYLTSRSISQGRRAGMISLAGTAMGFAIYMLMANIGLAVVFIAVPWLFIGFKAAGVAYLALLAWKALRPRGRGLFQVSDLPPSSDGRLFRMGLLTNLLNPKAAVMYLTLIPQFIDPQRPHPLLQGVLLGLVQISVSVIVNAVVVMTAGSLAAAMAKRPSWAAWQRRITGSLLGTVAVLLAREVPARAGA